MTRIPQLDGLRGVAAMIVVLAHAGNLGLIWRNPQSGHIGVMLFFALSGFLMAWLYGMRDMTLRGWASYAARRFFRVYPLFVLAVLWSLWVPRWSYRVNAENYLDHLRLADGVSVLWTIPVEIKYYLVFPFVALAVHAIRSRTAQLTLLAALIAFFALVPMPKEHKPVWPFMSYFLMGYAAAVALAWIKERSYPGWLADLAFACSCAAIVLAMPVVMNALTGYHYKIWSKPLALSLLVGVTVLSCALSPRLAPLLLGNPVTRFIGKISFSLYLSHMLVLRYVKSHSPDWLDLPLSMIAVFCVATLLWLIIERPSQWFGQSVGRLIARGRPVRVRQAPTPAE
ncbi:MAG: acyltransferase [Hyphomonas sp.]